MLSRLSKQILRWGHDGEDWNPKIQLNRGRYVMAHAPGVAAEISTKSPYGGVNDGPTGVGLVRLNIIQLRNAVDGDNGGAIGCQPVSISRSFSSALEAEELDESWATD